MTMERLGLGRELLWEEFHTVFSGKLNEDVIPRTFVCCCCASLFLSVMLLMWLHCPVVPNRLLQCTFRAWG